MQSPASNKLSQGNNDKDGSEISYTSPGTSSVLITCRPEKKSTFFSRDALWNYYRNHCVGLESHTRTLKVHEDEPWSICQLEKSLGIGILTDLVSRSVAVILMTEMKKMQIA